MSIMGSEKVGSLTMRYLLSEQWVILKIMRKINFPAFNDVEKRAKK